MPTEEHLELVRKAAEACDLGEYTEQLQALIRPSVVLATSRAKASEIAIGGTKIGGTPDMPDSVEWPHWRGQPLSFVGQINLAEIAPFQLGLPRRGLLLLYFYFDSELQAVRPQNSGAGVVLFVPQEVKLIPRNSPGPAMERFRKCSVKYISYPSLPPAYGDRVEELWGLEFLANDDLQEAYAELIHQVDDALGINKLSTSEGYNYHQLFGYPCPVQRSSIEVQMERARNLQIDDRSCNPLPTTWREQLWEGFKSFALSRSPPPQPASVTAGESKPPPDELERCRDWQLLFMLREDEHADIRLIDSGCIYYMYPTDQLFRGDFSHPWTMLDFG